MGVLKIQFSQVETETLRFSLWQHKPKPTQNTSFALLKPKARIWEKRPGVESVISAFGTCVCVYCIVYRGGSFTLTLQDCVCIAVSTGVVVSHWHYKTVQCSFVYIKARNQWRNTHWTRLDKCQGPPGSRGPCTCSYLLHIALYPFLCIYSNWNYSNLLDRQFCFNDKVWFHFAFRRFVFNGNFS